MKQAEGSAQGADKRIACHAVRVAACLVRCLTTPSREVHLGQPPRLSSNDSLICVGVVQLPKKTQRQCIIQYVIKKTQRQCIIQVLCVFVGTKACCYGSACSSSSSSVVCCTSRAPVSASTQRLEMPLSCAATERCTPTIMVRPTPSVLTLAAAIVPRTRTSDVLRCFGMPKSQERRQHVASYICRPLYTSDASDQSRGGYYGWPAALRK